MMTGWFWKTYLAVVVVWSWAFIAVVLMFAGRIVA